MKSSARISIRDTYGEHSHIYYPIIIIGTGPSGTAMGCQSKSKLHFDQFKIFDGHEEPGGTWWANTYPRIVAEVSEMMDKINLNTEFKSLRWKEEEEEKWEIEICQFSPKAKPITHSRLETIRAKVVISGAGILTNPDGWPETVSGRNTFSGEILHSARWPRNDNLKGKDVVLISSGCTTAQIAPSILRTQLELLTHIIRNPPWCVPRIEEPGGKEVYAKFAPTIHGSVPILDFLVRFIICCMSELLRYATYKRNN
ncbi:putative flavin-binding protein [Botrytis fragariae]|uniref:Putative flavin-binding protein n=1 Tax=Botrytis fragariae TaxID=1964551 RepID=A0A8H6EMN7_9HELO|nr:putative flavin-binding protein [Botrytis fragariae]KAF5877739.1 putative flavin-binding protein [Botrytis fragariae]